MTSQSPTIRGSRRGFTNQSLGLAHPTDWMPFWDTGKPPIANLFHIFGVCFHPSFYKTVKVTRCLFKVMCTVNQWLISTFQGHPHLLHPSRTFIISEGQKLKEHRCGTVWFWNINKKPNRPQESVPSTGCFQRLSVKTCNCHTHLGSLIRLSL